MTSSRTAGDSFTSSESGPNRRPAAAGKSFTSGSLGLRTVQPAAGSSPVGAASARAMLSV